MDTVRGALVLLRVRDGAGRADALQDAPRDGPSLLDAIRAVARLEACGRKLRALGVVECNGVPDPRYDPKQEVTKWDDADMEANEKAREAAMVKARKIADPYGAKLRNQRDPRGPALRILTDNGGEWAL
jgi:hypothetical protein